MNIPGNIQKLGNYRYREDSAEFSILPNVFDPLDSGGFYTGATDADVTVELGFEDENLTPQLYSYPKDRSDYIGLLSLLGEIEREHLILMDHIYTILEN
jgi:hypothetical protein